MKITNHFFSSVAVSNLILRKIGISIRFQSSPNCKMPRVNVLKMSVTESNLKLAAVLKPNTTR